MPEGVEVRIMSDFINEKSKGRTYEKIFHIGKGNRESSHENLGEFKISSESFGKELILKLKNKEKEVKFSVFMGMSGNWKLVPTSDWSSTKFVRLRFDSIDGESLILYGGYMGPKYKLNGFKGVKRGPDIIKDFTSFKENVLSNLNKKEFQNPISEILLVKDTLTVLETISDRQYYLKWEKIHLKYLRNTLKKIQKYSNTVRMSKRNRIVLVVDK